MTTVAAAEASGRRATVGWCLGAGTAALLLVSTGRVFVLLPLLLVIGLALVVLAAARPLVFVVVGLSVIIVTALLERIGGAAAGNADEVVVMISVLAFGTRRLATEGRLVLPAFAIPIGLFLVAGVASSAVQHVPFLTAGSAGLVALKGALYAWALAQLHWGERELRVLARFGLVTAVVVVGTGILNLLAPGPWATLTTGRAPAHIGPLPGLNGLFQHPAAMSRFCALLALGGFAYLVVVRRRRSGVLLVVMAAALSILTIEVKSLLGLAAASVVLVVRWMRPGWAVALLCLAPLPLVLAGPFALGLVGQTLDDYVFQQSARLRISTGALQLAAQHFPLGAGLGRWGSSAAAAHYSPLYLEARFENVHGLSPRAPQFLNDTQWPAILGEAGWLGAACFAAALLTAAWSLARAVSDERPLEHWIRVAGFAWLISLVVESVGAAVFVSAPSYPFVFLAAGVIASVRADRRDRGSPELVAEPEPHAVEVKA